MSQNFQYNVLDFTDIIRQDKHNIIHPSKIVPTLHEINFASRGKTVSEIIRLSIEEFFTEQPSFEQLSNYLAFKQFLLIDFNFLCAHRYENCIIYPPLEVSFIIFSIVDGVLDEFHEFISLERLSNRYFTEASLNYFEHEIPYRNTVKFQELNPLNESDLEAKILEFFSRHNISENIIAFQLPHKIPQTFRGYDWFKCNSRLTSDSFPNLTVLSIFDLVFEVAKLRNLTKIDSEIFIKDFILNTIDKLAISARNRNCSFHNKIKNNCCSFGHLNRLVESILNLVNNYWNSFTHESAD